MMIHQATGGSMRALTTGIVLAVLLSVPAMAGETTEGGIAWVKSFDDAVALAKQTNRHLVADFWTPT
jgi:hypothetical protein